VWEKAIGEGFAGPVVDGDRVVLFHRVRSEEVVEALDARTGKELWRYSYGTAYRDDFGFDEGPRAVPVVAGGRVYTFGAEGQLHALDAATGRRIWSVDTAGRFGVRKGFFGAAGSPLVEDGRVIANIGGMDGAKGAGIVAFSAATGAVLWTATDHQASYSSPVGATFGGRRHALFFTRNGLVGLDPATGAMLFQRPWRSRSASSVNAATPLVVGDVIFLSATYETGAVALRVNGTELSPLWSSDDAMSNHYATSVYSNGYVYGFHGRQEFGPSFRAIDLETGAVKWSEDRYGAGSVTLAGDRLLIVRETGELVLAAASPDAFRPLARAQVVRGTVRALPAVADGFVYLRNENTLVSLDLRK
jgi:outer membrane protein assembly factor BamB